MADKFNGVTGQKMVSFVVTVVGIYIPLNGEKKPFLLWIQITKLTHDLYLIQILNVVSIGFGSS